jgi:hypothetical protein
MSTSHLIAWAVVVIGSLPIAGSVLFMIARPFRRAR